MMVFILIGLSILSVVLGILSIGDDVNHKQVELNGIINSVVGFPIGQFKDGFPLLQNNIEFWKINNLILLFLNTLIQASGIVFIGKYIKRKRENK
ncbi:hypothetical protein FK220_019845 [Flavobacteriaceae bacterium TP-CH-4]|uniref:Uncharacterized protein n=1 Tax=Pelagihabitans pacificus TaxID=2696054 RepID=A0A967AWS3_9FLAO|nr:hypothetical protein [Pelagihabitans pacificus]NHF61613.1 hypothetical protein [Pelagihabitans pacificus]